MVLNTHTNIDTRHVNFVCGESLYLYLRVI